MYGDFRRQFRLIEVEKQLPASYKELKISQADSEVFLPYQTQLEGFQTNLSCLLNFYFARIRVLTPDVKDHWMLTVE
jgi:hypothetical protein